jgi:hypothetical protein
MGWQDRDYRRERPDDSDDDFVDPSDDDTEEDYSDAEDDDSDDLDPEAPDEADIGSDEPVLVHCPNCGKMILEEAEQCHHCGHFMMEQGVSSGWPIWMWIGLSLALIVALLWGLFG